MNEKKSIFIFNQDTNIHNHSIILFKKDNSLFKRKIKLEKNFNKKRKNLRNANIFSLKFYINIFLVISMILLIKFQTTSESTSSFVLLKFNQIGLVKFLGTNFNILPTHVYIDNIEQDESTINSKLVNITNITEVVKLEWVDTKIENCREMFNGLIYVVEIDVSGFDSSFISNTAYMFSNCGSLTSIKLTGFDTSLVTTMEGMFSEDKVLRPIDLSSFDTSRVINMALLFYNCNQMNKIDVSNFNTSLVITMERMFQQVHYVETLNLSNFNT